MRSEPFDEKKDYAPTPFDRSHCEMAARLKNAGLRWFVHVGCFAWDPDGHLTEFSVLPNRVYFIINLSIFARALGGIDKIHRKLVWLPTWHQARLLCREYGVPDEAVAAIWSSPAPMGPGDELIALYELLLQKLQERDT
jgi:hypothetical protein